MRLEEEEEAAVEQGVDKATANRKLLLRGEGAPQSLSSSCQIESESESVAATRSECCHQGLQCKSQQQPCQTDHAADEGLSGAPC